jgi:hypothetical protein
MVWTLVKSSVSRCCSDWCIVEIEQQCSSVEVTWTPAVDCPPRTAAVSCSVRTLLYVTYNSNLVAAIIKRPIVDPPLCSFLFCSVRYRSINTLGE